MKETNFKIRTYYFFNDVIKIKDLHPNKIKTYKKSYKIFFIYYIGYVTVKNLRHFAINSANCFLKVRLSNFWKCTKFIRLKANSFFNCFNTKGVRFITRLWLGLIHQRDHKFKPSFQDCLNPLCSYGIEIETTAHCFN